MKSKLLCLISGGIDSAVSSYMMIERGFDIILLHFNNEPYADTQNISRVEAIAKLLKSYYKQPLELCMVRHGENQAEIMKKCDRHLTCVFCKRLMYLTAQKVADDKECQALVTGESIGQVASQTLKNIRAMSTGIRIPILRPLIGLDKEEIMSIAKRIGTYETSVSADIRCTALPSKPATATNPGRLLREEQKLNVNEMVQRSFNSLQVKLIS